MCPSCSKCYYNVVHLLWYQSLPLKARTYILQADKTNLQKKVVELDDLVKKLCGTQTTHPRHGLMRSSTEFNKMPTDSKRHLDRRSQHHKSENSRTTGKLDGHGSDLKFR